MTAEEGALDRIEAIYERLPKVECKGLCWNSCGPIDMSPVERERVEAAGVHIQPYSLRRSELWSRNIRRVGDESLVCAALTPEQRCSVYEVRPFICRVWGVGRGEMACPHGCKLTGTRLRSTEILALLSEVMYEGGGLSVEERALMDATRGDPQVMALFNRYIAGDRSVRGQIVAMVEERVRRGACC